MFHQGFQHNWRITLDQSRVLDYPKVFSAILASRNFIVVHLWSPVATVIVVTNDIRSSNNSTHDHLIAQIGELFAPLNCLISEPHFECESKNSHMPLCIEVATTITQFLNAFLMSLRSAVKGHRIPAVTMSTVWLLSVSVFHERH
jgi:hypothetical protein